jgi:hypothetical protein
VRALQIASLIPLLLALSSCCERKLEAQHPSPSGKRVLSLVRVNCGAFTSFHTEVRLGREATGGELVATLNSSPVVQVTWVGDTLVQIFAPKDTPRDLKKPDYDGVHIEFR